MSDNPYEGLIGQTLLRTAPSIAQGVASIAGVIKKREAASQLITAQTSASIATTDFLRKLSQNRKVTDYAGELERFRNTAYQEISKGLTNSEALRTFDLWWEGGKATVYDRIMSMADANSTIYGEEALVSALTSTVAQPPGLNVSLSTHYANTLKSIGGKIGEALEGGIINPDQAAEFFRTYSETLARVMSRDMAYQAMDVMLRLGMSVPKIEDVLTNAIRLEGPAFDRWAETGLSGLPADGALVEILMAFGEIDMHPDNQDKLVKELRGEIDRTASRREEQRSIDAAAYEDETLFPAWWSKTWQETLIKDEYSLIDDSPLTSREKEWWRAQTDKRIATLAAGDSVEARAKREKQIGLHEREIETLKREPDLEKTVAYHQTLLDDPVLNAVERRKLRNDLNGIESTLQAARAKEAKEVAEAVRAAELDRKAREHEEALRLLNQDITLNASAPDAIEALDQMRIAVEASNLGVPEIEKITDEIDAYLKTLKAARAKEEEERLKALEEKETTEDAETYDNLLTGLDDKLYDLQRKGYPSGLAGDANQLTADQINAFRDEVQVADLEREDRLHYTDELGNLYDIYLKGPHTNPVKEAWLMREFMRTGTDKEIEKTIMDLQGDGFLTADDAMKWKMRIPDRERYRNNVAYTHAVDSMRTAFDGHMQGVRTAEEIVNASSAYLLALSMFDAKINEPGFRDLDDKTQAAELLSIHTQALAPLERKRFIEMLGGEDAPVSYAAYQKAVKEGSHDRAEQIALNLGPTWIREYSKGLIVPGLKVPYAFEVVDGEPTLILQTGLQFVKRRRKADIAGLTSETWYYQEPGGDQEILREGDYERLRNEYGM